MNFIKMKQPREYIQVSNFHPQIGTHVKAKIASQILYMDAKPVPSGQRTNKTGVAIIFLAMKVVKSVNPQQ